MKVYVEHNKIDQAIEVLNSSTLSDLFTIDYYSTMLQLKQTQARTGNVKRDLDNSEIESLKNLLIRLDERIKDREVRKMLVESTAQIHRKNLIAMEGFEKQQDKFNNMDSIIVESINRCLGVSIDDNYFVASCNVSSEVSKKKKKIYKKIKSESMLSKIKLSTRFAKKRGKIVANDFFLDEKDFSDFLQNYKDANLQNFSSELKGKFKFPDLGEFWKILVENDVIQNEQKLFVLDKLLLENFDPSALEIFDKLAIQDPKSKTNEVFMFSLVDMNDQQALLTAFDVKQEFPGIFKRYKEKQILSSNKRASLIMGCPKLPQRECPVCLSC